jgi:hypothetical protein
MVSERKLSTHRASAPFWSVVQQCTREGLWFRHEKLFQAGTTDFEFSGQSGHSDRYLYGQDLDFEVFTHSCNLGGKARATSSV